jgi:putative hydrolase of the HAD superfamily
LIKNIIFDLGKVLIDYDWSILYRKLDGKISEEELNDNAEILLDFDAGKLSQEEFYTIIRSRFDLNLTFVEFKNIWCDIFKEIPEMIALADTLQKKYRLFLFSNTDKLHFPYIWKTYPALHIFSKNLMLSYELKSVKPCKESYIRAINKFNLKAEECIIIDDKLENVMAARQLGIAGIRHLALDSTIAELKGYGIL